MTQTATGGIKGLRSVMEGSVIVPGDPAFDEGRRVWNAGIDRRPCWAATMTARHQPRPGSRRPAAGAPDPPPLGAAATR